ncbi:MFS general substrate transporter [Pseudohyphozyma bogoriensis]|nr:MFS general substrate transporter [Pseudohyphozyma bogoriensis]
MGRFTADKPVTNEKVVDGQHKSALDDDANVQVTVVDQSKQKQSWLGYIWDTSDLSSQERRLLFKLDATLLIFGSLGYFIKNLDQTNVQSAFFAGMEEDLAMTSNQLVTSTSIWTVGYVVGQVPVNLALTRISPRYVIPFLEFGWGLSTLMSYAVKSYKTLYVTRFLVGLFESGFYPGMVYILGCFYSDRELSKRNSIFWCAGTLGQMFSGFLQTAAYNNLSGVGGLAGWRWLFIIDGIISVPIAILGLVFLPNLPWAAKPSFLLNSSEIELARARMRSFGRQEARPWTKSRVKSLFTTWHIYVLPILYVIWNNAYMQSPMQYWLKSFNASPAPVPGKSYSVSQIQLLPLPTSAIFVVCSLIFAWLSDGPAKARRWPFIIGGAIFSLAIAAALIDLPLYGHDAAHFALYYLCLAGNGCGPLIFAWIAELTSGDNEKRALLIAMGNDLAYVVQAVAPNFVWKTTDFPKARKGLSWIIGLNTLLVLYTMMVMWFARRQKRQEAADAEIRDHEAASSNEESGKASISSTDTVDGSPAAGGEKV